MSHHSFLSRGSALSEPHGRTAPVTGAPDDAGRRTPPARIVVLLPALNEELGVAAVLDEIPFGALRERGYDTAVWVVDGKSTDATLAVAAGRGAQVFVQRGNGKGYGMRQAFRELLRPTAQGAEPPRFFFMLDADGTYPPARLTDFVAALEAGRDVVLGSRFLGRFEDGAISGLNAMGNRLLSSLARFLYGVPVSDVCTGMWGFSREALERLVLEADGFDLEANLFASAWRTNADLAEIAIDYRRRIGEPKLVPLRAGLRIAWRLLMGRMNGGARDGPGGRA